MLSLPVVVSYIFDVGWFAWATPDRVILIIVALGSGALNYFQFRNGRAEVIHKTDLKTIASLETALGRAEADRDAEKARVEVERARAESQTTELSSVKRELVALMSIDIHELLGYAALKRRNDALEKECQFLNDELAHASRQPHRALSGGEKGGA